MMFLGVDIGTGSSKAVLVDEGGTVVRSAARRHVTATPWPGRFEHDAEATWWSDFRALTRELLSDTPPNPPRAVCVSGIGPCVLVADADGRPLRPAILYGIDGRAEQEIEQLTEALGAGTLVRRTGNSLTTQAVGPKLLWLQKHEPDVWARTRRWFSASNWLAHRLTGEYVLDHYSASGADPLYDLTSRGWWPRGCELSAGALEQPNLTWPGEVVGDVLPAAAAETGLAAGTPVIAGTIDALAEAYSAGCRDVGDTMLMYGSTLFMIQTVAAPAAHAGLWALTGRTDETYSLAAGMSTAGLLVDWLADVLEEDVAPLIEQAAAVPAASNGLVLLPYLAGERTPIFDPRTRGVWLGLTLRHGRGHLFRSALEAIALGVRHNLDTMAEAGAAPARLVAVGGGTRGGLLTQITSDATGLPQDLPTLTIGASYGDARMAADALGVDTSGWNPVAERIEPNPASAPAYRELYDVYRRTYVALRDDLHRLDALAAQLSKDAPPA
jgi:xylulokinase